MNAAEHFALFSNEHRRLDGREPVSIHCLHGTVWVTTEGNSEDIILRAGEAWHPAPHKLTVVGALRDAELCIQHAA